MSKKIFLLFLGGLFMAGQAEALSLTQKMDVEIGVFDAAEIKLTYQANIQQFNIGAEVNTANLFNTLYPFVGSYHSKGQLVEDKVLPELYQTYTKTRHHVRTKKVLYNSQGVAYKRISTKDKKQNEKPIVNVPKTADAADLQSVFADLLNKFQRTQSCNLTREVYDGKKHYKVIGKDVGRENRYFDWLKREENAYRCSIYIENLKDNNDNILWEVSADKPIKVWLGQDAQTKLPFVLEIVIDSTPLGMLEVKPRSLEIK